MRKPLSLSDPRAVHILKVLKRSDGEEFDAGIVGGPRGKAWIARRTPDTLLLQFRGIETPPALPGITMIIGAARPVVMKRLLKDLTTLGMGRLIITGTDKGESSYLKSRLWEKNEYETYLIEGAEQAFCTRLPEVIVTENITEAILKSEQRFDDRNSAPLRSDPQTPGKWALDNYEAQSSLYQALTSWKHEQTYLQTTATGAEPPREPVLAVGAERGWSNKERGILRESGFRLVHLGTRVLRTETACIAAASMVMTIEEGFTPYPESP